MICLSFKSVTDPKSTTREITFDTNAGMIYVYIYIYITRVLACERMF